MRIIFMGTPDFSTATLRALMDAGHEIVAVYSQPPRPAGRRGLELKPSPVHILADQHGIEVRTPKSLKSDEAQAQFKALSADVAVVVAYGLLLPQAILDGTKHGCYNGHASLLPRWRGAAPIQRAIMAGDTETGMMIMKMDEGLDTGPWALVDKIAITPDMTAGKLHDALMALSGPLAVKAMDRLENGTLALHDQSQEGVTYAAKIDKAECRIDFDRPAQEVHQHIMGLSPFPGAFFELGEGKKATRIKVLESAITADGGADDGADTLRVEAGIARDDGLTIACRSGSVRLKMLQKAGSKAMDADNFLRGNPILKGCNIGGRNIGGSKIG